MSSDTRGEPRQGFYCWVDVPVGAGWANVELVRSAVRGCLVAMLKSVDETHAIAMVAAELLENAVRHGDWSHSRARFRIRIQGSALGCRVEVENPVVPDGARLRSLLRTLEGLAKYPTPVEAYCAQVHRIASAAGGHCELGLARIGYEGDCDVVAEVLEPGLVRVCATSRARPGESPFEPLQMPAQSGLETLVRLAVPNSWQNSELVRVSAGLLVQTAIGPGEHGDCVGMASGELMENAFKYGGPGVVTYALSRRGATLDVEVTQAPKDAASLYRLREAIDWIQSFSDVQSAYLSRMQDYSAEGASQAGGLGLVRIAYEGRCALACESDADGRVHVRASYPLPVAAGS